MSSRSQSWRELSFGAKVFISLVVVAGTCVLLYGAIRPTSKNIAQFICYLLIAILAARLKVRLPGITGAWQITEAGNQSVARMAEIDLAYQSTGTVRSDLKIAWRTIAIALRGAVE